MCCKTHRCKTMRDYRLHMHSYRFSTALTNALSSSTTAYLHSPCFAAPGILNRLYFANRIASQKFDTQNIMDRLYRLNMKRLLPLEPSPGWGDQQHQLLREKKGNNLTCRTYPLFFISKEKPQLQWETSSKALRTKDRSSVVTGTSISKNA
jgi:hypothetical protein